MGTSTAQFIDFACRDKWSIGLIKNRFRLFFGYFTLHESLFDVTITVAALLVNYRIRRGVIPPMSEEKMLDRLEHYRLGLEW